MKLVVDGEVLAPLALDFDDLAALPGQIEDISTVVAGRSGGGVRLSSILARAGIKANATHLTCESSDGGFKASVALRAASDAIVAYRLAGDVLPRKHGGPLRFFIPDAAGCAAADVDQCANVKFLARLFITKGAGDDTRPTSASEHAKLHEH